MQKSKQHSSWGNILNLNYSLQKLPCVGTILCRNYPLQELSFAGTILCRNYPLQELPFAGTILCRNYLFLQLFLASNHFHLSSFGSCKFWAPCACPLVWAKKSSYHCSMQKGPNKKTRKMHWTYFQIFQIFSDILGKYLTIFDYIFNIISCSKFK